MKEPPLTGQELRALIEIIALAAPQLLILGGGTAMAAASHLSARLTCLSICGDAHTMSTGVLVVCAKLVGHTGAHEDDTGDCCWQ